MALIDNLKWSSIGVVFRYILQILSIVILTRWLNPEDFGLLASILIVTSIVTVLAQGGAVQIIGTSNDDTIKINFITCAILSIFISTIMIFILFVFKFEITKFLHVSDVDIYLVLISTIIFRSSSSFLEGLSVYYGYFKEQAKIETASYFIGYFITSVSLVYLGFGIYGIAIGTAIQPIISVCLYQRMLSPKIKLIVKDSQIKPMVVFKRAKYIIVSQLASNFISQVDNLIVNKYFGLKDLGFYTRSYQMMVIPCNFFGQVINKVFLNYFSNSNLGNSNLIRKSIILSFFFSIFVKLFLLLFGNYLVTLLFGSDWLPITSLIIVLSASIFPRLIYKVAEPILISSGNEKHLTIYVVTYAVSLLFFIFTFMSDNVMSIALSISLSTWLYSLLCFRKVVEIHKIRCLKIYLIVILSMLSDLCIFIKFY
uniref:Polysaccharide biosynthesis protein n=1 Tax=Vibrio parahaemolyticus TaxID=670 RepID=A0A5P4S6Y9_VIBPH|nr:polysaccharide biosynthesis protein [Vibrio parahaemolyticus]